MKLTGEDFHAFACFILFFGLYHLIREFCAVVLILPTPPQNYGSLIFASAVLFKLDNAMSVLDFFLILKKL